MLSERFDDRCVARGVGERADKDIVPLHFEGHALYCRKCLTGEAVDNARHALERQVGGIVLPESVADRTFWLEVLGVGPSVGKPCGKMHKKRFARARCMDVPCVGGDMILVPTDDDPAIMRSPLEQNEFFIEESFPVAIWRDVA